MEESALLKKLKDNGHNPEQIEDGTYRCRNCGRYVVAQNVNGKETYTGAMLKGKCAGTLRPR